MEKRACNSEDHVEVRKGPWTMEEDLILINYIANHGEGVWNSFARSAGLKRTGKSCRLRWLNYLRPDVRRGNITADEQLLIIELHAKWGNRWSKIAKHLPGRTDNEIKNFWRTRIQKHIKQPQTSHVFTPQISDNVNINEQPTFTTQNITSSYAPADHAVAQSYPLITTSSSVHENMPAFQSPFLTQSTDNMWTVDDLWCMQSLLWWRLIN